MPALVLRGDEDAAVAYEAGVRPHELIAHSERVSFTGAGHNHPLAYEDAANTRVLDFLARVDTGAVLDARLRPKCAELWSLDY